MRLVVVDADVLGRRRTGDETYVSNLLRELPGPAEAAGLRIAAVTRHPELVPDGVAPIALTTGSQELPHGLDAATPAPSGRSRPRAHAVRRAAPLPVPRGRDDPRPLLRGRDTTMGARDRLVFRRVVPRAARAARVVLTVSERSRRTSRPSTGSRASGSWSRRTRSTRPSRPEGPRCGRGTVVRPRVGAVEERKNQEAALRAARAAGLELVVVGPVRDASLAARLRAGGARLEGYVTLERLVEPLPWRGLPGAGVSLRGVRPAGDRGDGVRDPGRRRRRACTGRGRRRRCRGRAEADLAAGSRAPWSSVTPSCGPASSAPGRSRGRRAPGSPSARTRGSHAVRVSAVIVSHGHREEVAALVPALLPQVDELVVIANLPGSVPVGLPHGVRVIENGQALSARGEREPGHGRDLRRARPQRHARHAPRARSRRRAARAARARTEGRDRGPTTGLAGRDAAAFTTSVPHRQRHARATHAPPSRPRHLHPAGALRPRGDADRARAAATGCSGPSCCSGGRCSTSSAAGTRATGTTSRTSTSSTARCGRAGSGGTCRRRSSSTPTRRSSTSGGSRVTRSGTRGGWRGSCVGHPETLRAL